MDWFSNLLRIRCAFCGNTEGRAQVACAACARQLAELESLPAVFAALDGMPVVAAMVYEGWTQTLLLEQKKTATGLAVKWLAAQLHAKIPEHWRRVPLAWVPGSAFKTPHLVDRIALELAKLGQPLVPRRPLARRFFTGKPQKALGLEERNARDLREVYRPLKRAMGLEPVLLFDDILTTGATMTGCAAILKEDLGIEIKGVLALAYTPRLR